MTVDVTLTTGIGRSGAKGDPGGNVMSVGLDDDITDIEVPEGTDRIETTGTDEVGVGPGTWIASADTTSPASWRRKKTSDDRWFERHFDGREMSIEATGAKTSRSDNSDYLAEAAAWITERGGGKIIITPGDYICAKWVTPTDGVFMEGQGFRSHIICDKTDGNVNERNTMQFGTYQASSDENVGFPDEDGFDLEDEAGGTPYVRAATIAHAGDVVVGDKVVLYNGATAEGRLWRAFQQLNYVVAVDAVEGKVYLAYPLYKDFNDNPRIGIIGSAGLIGMGEGGQPARFAFRAGIRNLALYSEAYKAIGFSGALECRFDNILCTKTERLFSGSGLAHSTGLVRGGAADQMGNAAWFSHNNDMTLIGWWNGVTRDGSNDALLLEENTHDNIWRIVCDGGLSPDLAHGIKIAKSAENNRVERFIHRSQHPDAQLIQIAYSAEGMPGGGNIICDPVGDYPNATSGGQINSTVACLSLAAGRPDRIISAKIYAPNLSAGQRTVILNAGAAVRIEGLDSDRGGVTCGATDVVITDWNIRESALGAITDNAGDLVMSKVWRRRMATLKRREATNIPATSSTTPVDFVTATYAAGALSAGDRVRFEAGGAFTGTGNAKFVAADFGGANVGLLSAIDADNLGWKLSVELSNRLSNSQRSVATFENETPLAPAYTSTTVDTAAGAVTAKVQGYVGGGADSVVAAYAAISVHVPYWGWVE